MYVDDLAVSVPVNAYEALQHLCSHRKLEHIFSRSGRKINIWIDAVCIDQSNVEERNAQVAMMGKVFATAKEVLVYLGDSKGKEKESFSLIDEIYEHCSRTTGGFKRLTQTLYTIPSAGTMRHTYDQTAVFRRTPKPTEGEDRLYFTPEQWRLIMDLYNCPWYANRSFKAAHPQTLANILLSMHRFRRLWVVQEVKLAKRALCYYGQRSIEASKLLLAAVWMEYGYHGLFEESAQLSKGLSRARAIYQMRVGETGLWYPIGEAWEFLATDAHDKVYAVLGLLREETRTELNSYAPIEPDYNKSLRDVYRDTTRAMLMSAQEKLSILFWAGSWWNTVEDKTTVGDGFPSWVTRLDLDADLAHREPSFGEYSQIEERDVRMHCGSYCTLCGDPNVLSIRSERVDKVIYVDGLIIGGMDLRGLREYFRSRLHTWAAALPLLSPGLSNDPLHICRTLACGTTLERTDASKDQAFLRGMRSVTDQGPRSLMTADEKYFLSAIYDYARGRAFFVTATGLLGLGSCVHVGDTICHIFGETWPFVLRPRDARWELVSSAYIQDMYKVSLLHYHSLKPHTPSSVSQSLGSVAASSDR
jgi:hypothetical protein